MGCAACNRAVPDTGRFCAYCGGELGPPVTQPFSFRGGQQARVPEDLVPLSDEHWEEARSYVCVGKERAERLSRHTTRFNSIRAEVAKIERS